MMKLGLDEDVRKEATSFTDTLKAILARTKTQEGLVVTCIGANGTPDDMLSLMTRIGRALDSRGAILRSGGANEADLAFEAGWRNAGACEIFHPWHGFHPKTEGRSLDEGRILKRRRPNQGMGSPIVLVGAHLDEAEEIASSTHPAWEKCNEGTRSLHVRAIPQVVGASLTRPSDLMVCWTDDGRASGSIAHAMRYAQRKGVQIVNLKRQADRQAILEALGLED